MPVVLAPPIQVRPVPALDPPYDDEDARPPYLRLAGIAGQATLPLDWTPRPGRLSAAGGRGQAAGERGQAAGGPGQAVGERGQAASPTAHAAKQVGPAQPSPRSDGVHRSPARGAAMHFLSLCLEVLNGFRPPPHLRPLTAPSEFPALAQQVSRALDRIPRGPRRPRVRLRELRVCEPRPGVAEAAAVLGHGDRVWAMAVRLERRPAGWLCTFAQVI